MFKLLRSECIIMVVYPAKSGLHDSCEIYYTIDYILILWATGDI
jgi:hypothetical protein